MQEVIAQLKETFANQTLEQRCLLVNNFTEKLKTESNHQSLIDSDVKRDDLRNIFKNILEYCKDSPESKLDFINATAKLLDTTHIDIIFGLDFQTDIPKLLLLPEFCLSSTNETLNYTWNVLDCLVQKDTVENILKEGLMERWVEITKRPDVPIETTLALLGCINTVLEGCKANPDLLERKFVADVTNYIGYRFQTINEMVAESTYDAIHLLLKYFNLKNWDIFHPANPDHILIYFLTHLHNFARDDEISTQLFVLGVADPLINNLLGHANQDVALISLEIINILSNKEKNVVWMLIGNDHLLERIKKTLDGESYNLTLSVLTFIRNIISIGDRELIQNLIKTQLMEAVIRMLLRFGEKTIESKNELKDIIKFSGVILNDLVREIETTDLKEEFKESKLNEALDQLEILSAKPLYLGHDDIFKAVLMLSLIHI
eukprot:TRINITY_DN12544_c0_g5_i3.p1 TRINITY_DN12544_c0_g5~~TRINITY_DN12544_c0_g5_i3.p1  ORF type:complete len:433 (-),score=60.34 TRINITY_DN12544_c0_g5_i3:62-1360(-)